MATLINYRRGPVLSFWELEDNEQEEVSSWMDEPEDASYVKDGHGHVLDLGSFMRIDNKNSRWHGSAHVSNNTWHVIRISSCGTDALVALYTT